MDKSLKIFLYSSLIIILSIVFSLGVFLFIQAYSTMDFYSFVMNLIVIIMVFFIICLIAIILLIVNAYNKNRVNFFTAQLLTIAKTSFMPFIIFIADILGLDKDALRRVYVRINNLTIYSSEYKANRKDILIIIPHCLQFSGCSKKITNNIENCTDCGKCNVSKIKNICKEYGVKLLAVTGGTAAREAVKSGRPKIIISVACERDLVSGISDVKKVPVVGILNKRPNGPCIDTCVDTSEIEQVLRDFIKEPENL